MFSEIAQQILANPTHIGPLPDATHVGVAGVPGDGPYMQIWLVVENATIRDAAFKTFGCPSATACGCLTARILTGLKVEKALLLTAPDIIRILGGLPEGREFCADLAVTAMRNALEAGGRA